MTGHRTTWSSSRKVLPPIEEFLWWIALHHRKDCICVVQLKKNLEIQIQILNRNWDTKMWKSEFEISKLGWKSQSMRFKVCPISESAITVVFEFLPFTNIWKPATSSKMPGHFCGLHRLLVYWLSSLFKIFILSFLFSARFFLIFSHIFHRESGAVAIRTSSKYFSAQVCLYTRNHHQIEELWYGR